MIHSYEPRTYFREAEQDGYIGARGYFGYLQDGVTGVFNLVDKGNVTLVEKYRAPWIFLRYRMHFAREVYAAPVRYTDLDKTRHMNNPLLSARYTWSLVR